MTSCCYFSLLYLHFGAAIFFSFFMPAHLRVVCITLSLLGTALLTKMVVSFHHDFKSLDHAASEDVLPPEMGSLRRAVPWSSAAPVVSGAL